MSKANLRATIREQQDEIARLRFAMSFYADSEHYKPDGSRYEPSKIDKDGGSIARSVLIGPITFEGKLGGEE